MRDHGGFRKLQVCNVRGCSKTAGEKLRVQVCMALNVVQLGLVVIFMTLVASEWIHVEELT